MFTIALYAMLLGFKCDLLQLVIEKSGPAELVAGEATPEEIYSENAKWAESGGVELIDGTLDRILVGDYTTDLHLRPETP